MPNTAISIDVTETEVKRIDAIAAEEKRNRKQQTYYFALLGLAQVEAGKSEAEKAAAKTK